MKTIEWDKISDQDMNMIGLIVERAKTTTAFGSTLYQATIDELKQDLAAYHLASPLRLDDLLKASTPNLLHDVLGIYVSLNRDTGQPRACFTPRFTFKLTEEQEAAKLGKYLMVIMGHKVLEDGRITVSPSFAEPLALGLVVQRALEEKLYLKE